MALDKRKKKNKRPNETEVFVFLISRSSFLLFISCRNTRQIKCVLDIVSQLLVVELLTTAEPFHLVENLNKSICFMLYRVKTCMTYLRTLGRLILFRNPFFSMENKFMIPNLVLYYGLLSGKLFDFQEKKKCIFLRVLKPEFSF